jgi:enolase
VLDSRGNPTVEVEVTVGEGIVGIDGYTGRALVPSGASTGRFEAVELRDGDENCYFGKSVRMAVRNVNTVLSDAIVGENALVQAQIDAILMECDGTENKKKLGANAVLGVSLAVARAAAGALRIPLYQYLGGCHTQTMPVPMMNLLNGGKHSLSNNIDLQEFMIMPVGASCEADAIRIGAEIYQVLREVLNEKGRSTAVGDEGGFAPDAEDTWEVLSLLMEAIGKSGYKPGKDVCIALDAAASELYEEERGVYVFPGESKAHGKRVERDVQEMLLFYEKLLDEFPIVSIEDGLGENDWEGWKKMTQVLGGRVQLVGDDLFVTNPGRVRCGIKLGAANAVLVKPNQIGTLTETLETTSVAQRAGYRTVISHRSGDTEDSFLADLAVAAGAGQIKCGAPCRSERNAKYNELLRIEEFLGETAQYQNPF